MLENIWEEIFMQTETRPISIGRAFPVHPMWVAGALIVSFMGFWFHEFHRVPASIGFTPEWLLTLLFAALVFLPWWRFPRHVASIASIWALGLIHLLAALLTVLPLAFLPFVPEQTLSHYLVHMVYAVAQAPLFLVALRLARRRLVS